MAVVRGGIAANESRVDSFASSAAKRAYSRLAWCRAGLARGGFAADESRIDSFASSVTKRAYSRLVWCRAGLARGGLQQTSREWTRLLRAWPSESIPDSFGVGRGRRVWRVVEPQQTNSFGVGRLCGWMGSTRGGNAANESISDSLAAKRLGSFSLSVTKRVQHGLVWCRAGLARGGFAADESRIDSFASSVTKRAYSRLVWCRAGLARGGTAANESGIDSFALLGVERGQTSPEWTRLVSGDLVGGRRVWREVESHQTSLFETRLVSGD
ncbi:hypothetical protein GGU10DRAFT_382318 [Lentinula aff. detonsa]|uniref:Uncharacterized protein n=1 Tax=Lentinula aff. detonsa TaxID=2804958 RepID=A0AA38K7B2_9AGAR|nr:hypothetical protein GGU10DRAFT_382318 [Lentinula aff. detonsa]